MILKEYLEQDKPLEIKLATLNGSSGGFAFCGDPYDPEEVGDGKWIDDFFNREVIDAYLSIDPEFPNCMIYIVDGCERNHIYFRGEKKKKEKNSIYNDSSNLKIRVMIGKALRPLERKNSTTWKGFPGKDEVAKRQYERSLKHSVLSANFELGWWNDEMVSRIIKAKNEIQIGIVQRTLRDNNGKIKEEKLDI